MQYLTSLHLNTPDHTTQSCCHVRPAWWVQFSVVMLMKWERPGPTAALIGQAAGSTISSSKWRHVRPVRLQLGPDCFPEALEASPYLSAHHGGWRVHPTVLGPDLSWYETNHFSYGLMQAKNADINATQAGGHFLASHFTAADNLLQQVSTHTWNFEGVDPCYG